MQPWFLLPERRITDYSGEGYREGCFCWLWFCCEVRGIKCKASCMHAQHLSKCSSSKQHTPNRQGLSQAGYMRKADINCLLPSPLTFSTKPALEPHAGSCLLCLSFPDREYKKQMCQPVLRNEPWGHGNRGGRGEASVKVSQCPSHRDTDIYSNLSGG